MSHNFLVIWWVKARLNSRIKNISELACSLSYFLSALKLSQQRKQSIHHVSEVAQWRDI